MPEGHSIHRVARAFAENFLDQPLAVSSPQGRFAEGAAALDGHRAVRSRAHGKHFFLEFDHGLTLNVHLGLYGAWSYSGDEQFRAQSSIGAPRRIGERETPADPQDGGFALPEPRPTVRVRLVGEHGYADLVGATTCRVLDPTGVAELEKTLGPDPLDPEADPEPFFRAAAKTSRPIGHVLMEQRAIAGVGNIYRAESLFRAGLDPHTPAREVPRERLESLWRDLASLMAVGVRLGRIVTTAPEHRAGTRAEAADREHSHYVYLRQGRPCRVCGQDSVVVEDLGGRKLYWCTVCQTRPAPAARELPEPRGPRAVPDERTS